MGCCGGGGHEKSHPGGDAEGEKGGGINWIQAVAIGLVLMFLLGILLQVWH